MRAKPVCLNTFTMELIFFSRNALRLCRWRAAVGAESNTLPDPNPPHPTLEPYPGFSLSFEQSSQTKLSGCMQKFCQHIYFHLP